MGFLRRLALFVLPPLLALTPPLYVLVRSGELHAVDVDQVIAEQVGSTRHILFGPAYSDCTKYYKLGAAIAAKGEILALGTSRAMTFRAPFFRRRFYNAGGGATQVDQFGPFLAHLPRSARPKILIATMDHYFFNAAWHRPEPPFEQQARQCTNALNVVQRSWMRIYRDWVQDKFALGALRQPRGHEAVGLNALVNGNGFRNDGSMYYGQVIHHPHDPLRHHDLGFHDSFDRIRAGNRRFEWADHVDPRLVGELRPFLRRASELGIHVIAVVPPYAPSVNDRMASTGRYGYMGEIAGAVRPLVEAAGGSFFDFSDVRSLGLTDQYFIDGFHGSDRVYLQMVIEMARHDRRLAEVVDVASLERLKRGSHSRLLVDSEHWN